MSWMALSALIAVIIGLVLITVGLIAGRPRASREADAEYPIGPIHGDHRDYYFRSNVYEGDEDLDDVDMRVYEDIRRRLDGGDGA